MFQRIVCLLAVAGCGQVVSDPAAVDAPVVTVDAALDADAPPDAPVDAPAPIELAVEPRVTWSVGSAPVDAGATAGRACFLQGVAGMLKAPAHFVQVTAVGDRWLVSGSGAADQAIHVRCVQYGATSGVSVSPQFDWTQGQAAVDLGPAAGQICGLTRVAGELNGGGELVHTTVDGGRWVLRGTSSASGVSASARCLTLPAEVAVEGEVNWAQGDAVATLGAIEERACLLALLVGSFLGGAESIAIGTSGDSWVISGSSAQQGVAGRARCFTW